MQNQGNGMEGGEDENETPREPLISDRLVRAKERRARERCAPRTPHPAVATGRSRLPPGQRLVSNWPVLDLGSQPHVPLDGWRLVVDGLVDRPVAWDWNDFLAAPQVEIISDIHCVTAWSRYDNHWWGVPGARILEIVKPGPEARHILLHAYDGYTTNVTIEAFGAPDALIAHRWNGAPLSRAHGGPARLVIPRLYFWKSAKWIRRIEFRADDKPGFWEVRGYHNEGDPWREERYR